MLTAAILIIAFACCGGIAAVYSFTKRMDKQYPTKSLPPAPPKRTIQDILDCYLSNPPTGCLWEVKKEIKNYRITKHGRQLFDGSVDTVFITVRFIRPDGEVRQFSLPLSDSDHWQLEFEAALRNNVQICRVEYHQALDAKKRRDDQNGDWDGVYS